MIMANVVDLFCGAGGLSLGFRQAGFTPVMAFDFDRHACATYAANLGNHVHEVDLSRVVPSDFALEVLASTGGVDVVAGGPPCQGWSIQRRGNGIDARNDLTVQFSEIAAAINPKAIVMENVPTLFGKRGAKHLAIVEETFEKKGYRVYKKILDASSFGVAQSRRRAVLVAVSTEFDSVFEFPEPSHGNGSVTTVRQAIGDLPPPPFDGSDHPDYSNHKIVMVSAANLERLSYVPEGGGRLDVPEHLQLPCHRTGNGHRHLDVYGRLWWDRPAGTITAMFDNFTRGRFAHPADNRNITGREGARLQSFPDDYVFLGPKKDVARQIGNAVAPLMAEAVARALQRVLTSSERSKQFSERILSQ